MSLIEALPRAGVGAVGALVRLFPIVLLYVFTKARNVRSLVAAVRTLMNAFPGVLRNVLLHVFLVYSYEGAMGTVYPVFLAIDGSIRNVRIHVLLVVFTYHVSLKRAEIGRVKRANRTRVKSLSGVSSDVVR